MNNLAIIPARSGSKGLKDKNIKELNGLPLMAYSIHAALKSGKFSHVMVSTDSQLYADIAVEHGAEVPFLRDAATSGDSASSWDTVREVLRKYQQLGMEFDTVTLLQPTSPLRTAEDIVKAFALYQEKGATSVVSVCEPEHSPLWCNTLPDSLCMDGFLNHANNCQRQKLGSYYRLNGSIYIVDVDLIIAGNDIYNSGCYAYIMPTEHSIDIDTELDFVIAEAVMNNLSK